ncbi:MAG: hypothetical protein Q4B72_13610 [Lachnospiraceae bacterium]|nr:hypothetical protein [Lachnospiraceae bacterium]
MAKEKRKIYGKIKEYEVFTERNIKAAFQALCEMYEEEERWMMDDEIFALEGISNRCMANALKDRMEEVFEYKAVSEAGTHVDYRGRYLFDQRAVRIITVENFSMEDYHYGMEYDAELWLLEDMSFAVVHCFRTIMAKHEHLDALTEYRVINGMVECGEDLFFTIEELLEELDCICSRANSYRR